MKSFAIDTETTGLDPNRGAAPYLVGVCDEHGDVLIWEFVVCPYQRIVNYDCEQARDMVKWFKANCKARFFWWNRPFDLKMLATIPHFGADRVNDATPRNSFEKAHPHCNPLTSPILSAINANSHDGLVLSHQHNAEESHGLKDFGVRYLEIPDDDEKKLEHFAKIANQRGKRLQWRVSTKKLFPGLRGQYYKMDYWLTQHAEALGFVSEDIFDESGERLDRHYLGWDCRRTFLGTDLLLSTVQADPVQNRAYEEIHRPCVDVIIEQSCVALGVREAETLSRIRQYEKNKQDHFLRLTALLGEEYKPAVAEQKKRILYDVLKVTPFRNTPSGQPSTDKFVFKEIIKNKKGQFADAAVNAAVDMMAGTKYEWHERYAKSYITHSVPSPRQGRLLYLGLNQTGTRTGRLSSGGLGVNGQNIATGKEGIDKKHPTAWDRFLIENGDLFKLRGLFGPAQGCEWIIADYRQLQLFIFAYACQDQAMIDYLEAGGDAHDYVGCAIFGLDPDSEKPDEGQRRVAKVCNFGFIFGAQERRLERESGVTGLRELLKKRMPKAVKFLETTKRQAKLRGYVETLGGFKVWTPEEKLNAAVCDIVQGTEAEIVKRAMVKAKFEQNLLVATQVHDELVFDGPVGWHKWGAARVHEAMVGAGVEWDMKLGVKMELVEDGGAWNSPTRVLTPELVA